MAVGDGIRVFAPKNFFEKTVDNRNKLCYIICVGNKHLQKNQKGEWKNEKRVSWIQSW